MNRTSAPRGLSSRTPFWSSAGPYASIRVCITLVAVQVVLSPAMVALTLLAEMGGSVGVMLAITLALLWLAIPLGALYGIYLGAASGASEDPWMARGVGILCNGVYLAGGMLFALLCIVGSQQLRAHGMLT